MIIACMIVKDEAHVLGRCLASLEPFVDAYVISDTGSSDGTVQIVRDFLATRDGYLLEEPWIDFATNRNSVLDFARDQYEGNHFALTIDADEMLVGKPIPLRGDPRDAYDLDVEYAGTHYRRTALIRLDRPWRWIGPVHEYLEMGEPADIGYLSQPKVRVFHEGARSRDPETYRKDAALLEQALAEDPTNPRWQFYLGQSYRDAGMHEAAAEAYLVRAENPEGWWEERWQAGFQHARMVAAMGGDPIEGYLSSYAANPQRAEPLVELAAWLRMRERFAEAAIYASAATQIIPPESGLFVDAYAYRVRCWDELAVASYWCGDPFGLALVAAHSAHNADPDDARLAENVRQCEERFG